MGIFGKKKSAEDAGKEEKKLTGKDALLQKGKDLGLTNLKRSMSVYELEHRIKEREEELAKEKGQHQEKKEPAKRGRGEH